MIMRWIWLVPSPLWYTLAARRGGGPGEARALGADQVRGRHGGRVEVERRRRRAVDAVLAVGRADAEARRGAADDEGRHAARAPGGGPPRAGDPRVGARARG